MHIDSLRKMRDPVWFHPNREMHPDVEFQIVPAEAGTVLGGGDPLIENDRIARRAFVNLKFPGVTENTLDVRKIILSSWEWRAAIVGELLRRNQEASTGESVAASASPSGE